jgi:hypothetical protein
VIADEPGPAVEVRLASIFDEARHHLDEPTRRLLLGAVAREVGHGEISLVAEVTARATDTVGRGAAELAAGIEPDGWIRRKGRAVNRSPRPIRGSWRLGELVDGESRGDPMRALRWTRKSTAKLAGELTSAGYPCEVVPSSVELRWRPP